MWQDVESELWDEGVLQPNRHFVVNICFFKSLELNSGEWDRPEGGGGYDLS